MERFISKPTLFADTSKITEIERMMATQIFTGITTNPGIVAGESSGGDPMDGYRQIAEAFPGIPFSIQLLDEPLSELIERGEQFANISPDAVIKVPMFGNGRGLTAMSVLLQKNIKVNITGLMSAEQLLPPLMFNPNPDYVSLFFNRIKDYEMNPLKEIAHSRELIEKIGSKSKIIVGSIRRPEDVREAISAGAHIVTVTPKVFWRMVEHPKTEEFIKQSQESWNYLIKNQIISQPNSEIPLK